MANLSSDMNIKNIEEVERIRISDDFAAMTTLGKRLLSGIDAEFAPESGHNLLVVAADNGHAEACALVAVLAGAGVCRPQEWGVAFDYLQRSAELGWQPAQAQLLVLAGDRDLVANAEKVRPGNTQWKNVRNSIDIAQLLAEPPKQIVSESPRMRKIAAFVPIPICNWLIARSRDRLRRAATYDSSTGTATTSSSRTNSETDFNIVETDLPLLLLRERIAKVTGLPTVVMELTKVLHYEPGQQFAPHFDFIEPSTFALTHELAVRGQRLATFLVYLNDDYLGGETDFPRLGFRHRGQAGDAFFFANINSEGDPDHRTLHAGLAPTCGEKWMLSQWIRDRAPEGR